MTSEGWYWWRLFSSRRTRRWHMPPYSNIRYLSSYSPLLSLDMCSFQLIDMYNERMIEPSRLNTLAKHHPMWLNTTCDSPCQGVHYLLNERKTNTCFLVWRAGSAFVWLRRNENVLHERCLSNLAAKCRRDKNKLTHKYRPQKTKQNKKCREPQILWQACNNKRWTRLDIYR